MVTLFLKKRTMQSYRILYPSPTLIPYIKQYWILKIGNPISVLERIIPTGCIHLTFHRANPPKKVFEKACQPQVFVSGQTMTYSDLQCTALLDMICVVFQPHASQLFLRIPAYKFYNNCIDVWDLEDKELTAVSKRIIESSSDEACIQLLDNFFINRLPGSIPYQIQRIVNTINHINIQPQPSISQLAEMACYSTKQFNRTFTQHVGTTPKEFLRIVRLQRALHLLQHCPNIGFTELSYICGFYDQSHLIKEFRSFSGYTPKQYLSICNPYSDYFSE